MRDLMQLAEPPLQVVPQSRADAVKATVDAAFAEATVARPVLIAVPLYRRPELARQVVASLLDCAGEIRRLGGEVVLINDSPDDSHLAEALRVLVAQVGVAFPCRIERNAANLGFVRSCNQVFDEAVARGFDLLLLNSDTVVTPGALSEMARVARLDPMIGFVNPRSNNATLATLPYQDRFRSLPPVEARAAWEQIADRLPEVSYVPTAVGFCLWIRWAVMAEFGGFDEIYGMGYNEENDLVMRAGRRGYRAVLANHAFVWHEGHGSFKAHSQAAQLEAANRVKLLARYPEYLGLTNAYFGSPEQRAERLLGTLIPDAEGRVEVGLDFSSFTAAHNGTSEAGAQLLGAAATRWSDRFSLYVLCSEETYAFHDYSRFGVPRRDPHGSECYAAIFRIGQPYDWGVNERLVQKAATIGVFMLDTISLDCTQLYSPRLYGMWNFLLEHADLVATTSELTQAQIERRFALDADTLRLRSLHSLDLEDYRLPAGKPGEGPAAPGYLFVVGNHFWHKEVAATVRALAAADPERRIVVLAGGDCAVAPVDAGLHAPRGLEGHANVLQLRAGGLTAEQMGALYANAEAVIFPSHYEGFGMPVLNALAARRPVFVRPLPVFAEMVEALGGEANVHVFGTTGELVRALSEPPPWAEDGASPGRNGDAARAADDIAAALEAMIHGASYERIVRRIRALHTLHDFAGPRDMAAPTTDRVTLIAQHIGRVLEFRVRQVLAVRGAFPVLRWLYRASRVVRGRGWTRAAGA
jgi:GT2 family glycosyltransferase